MMRDYYQPLAAAFARGRLTDAALRARHPRLFAEPLAALSDEEIEQVTQLGLEAGLRLHRFKRTMDLPRVRAALGMLRGLQPINLLDVGSGRGAFLWPLLDAFPALPVTTVDLLDYRVADMQAVHDGGVTRLSASRQDVTRLSFGDNSFDVVTMLEVLEHIPDTERARAEVCRVAARAVIFSMPSKPDDNPEHIHLFTEERLRALLAARGVRRVNVSYVLNHLLVMATVTG